MVNLNILFTHVFWETIKKTIIGVKNWPKLFLLAIGVYNSVDVKFSNLGIYNFKNNEWRNLFHFVHANSWSKYRRDKIMSMLDQKDNEIIKIDGFKFSNDNFNIVFGMWNETFLDEQYDFNLSGGGG
ncbi:MAG: hypothetical protein LBM96_00265, partial [Methanobrevibacter sp.]|nr:hypothetical protein [Candidatus Methanoflexus mossambicus]